MQKFKIDSEHFIEAEDSQYSLDGKPEYTYKTVKMCLQKYLDLVLTDENFEEVFQNATRAEAKIKRTLKG